MKTLQKILFLFLLIGSFSVMNVNAQVEEIEVPECIICEQITTIQYWLDYADEIDFANGYFIPDACNVLINRVARECMDGNPKIELMINLLEKIKSLVIVRSSIPGDKFPTLIIYQCDEAIAILEEYL